MLLYFIEATALTRTAPLANVNVKEIVLDDSIQLGGQKSFSDNVHIMLYPRFRTQDFLIYI